MDDDFETCPSPPLTPTKSELDTFQVLSNSNFVDFKKEKPNSKTLANQAPLSPSFKKDEIDMQDDFREEYDDEDDDLYGVPPETTTQPTQKLPMPLPLPLTPPKAKPLPKFDVPEAWGGEDDKSQASKDTEIENEIEYEKQALLEELRNLERNGDYKPVKELTMKDTLEEIQFQYDRVQNELNTSQGVQFAISSIKMGSSLVETVLKKFGFSLVDGFSANLCKDPSKFNRPVTKLYKRYWRKGNMSPESELAMIVLGSLAWTMVQNKMNGGGGSNNLQPVPPAALPPTPKPTVAPPKVNLMQFSKEKEMEKKIEELQRQLYTSESAAEKLHDEKIAAENALKAAKLAAAAAVTVSSPKKVVTLGSKTNSLSSNVSSLKKKAAPLKL